jgi:hypothetical protein
MLDFLPVLFVDFLVFLERLLVLRMGLFELLDSFVLLLGLLSLLDDEFFQLIELIVTNIRRRTGRKSDRQRAARRGQSE